LRVKALMSFFKSETYARAFGKTTWSIPAAEMERGIEAMLSVLDPDVSELEGKDEQDAANHFLLDGLLMVIRADGAVSQQEVAWLEEQTHAKWPSETLAGKLSDPKHCQQVWEGLSEHAGILRNKVSEVGCANLWRVLIRNVAHCTGHDISEK